MSAVWITLAFVGGMFTWNRFGSWCMKRLGVDAKIRLASMRKLSTDGLVLVRNAANDEIDRRQKTLESA